MAAHAALITPPQVSLFALDFVGHRLLLRLLLLLLLLERQVVLVVRVLLLFLLLVHDAFLRFVGIAAGADWLRGGGSRQSETAALSGWRPRAGAAVRGNARGTRWKTGVGHARKARDAGRVANKL